MHPLKELLFKHADLIWHLYICLELQSPSSNKMLWNLNSKNKMYNVFNPAKDQISCAKSMQRNILGESSSKQSVEQVLH